MLSESHLNSLAIALFLAMAETFNERMGFLVLDDVVNSFRFPGCDRPHTWCDAHHVVHWAEGGPTAVQNLLLLCRRHHRAVHERSGFRLELLEGRPVFRRPDGSLLEDRAPP